jgi:hypothetical protein
MGYAASRSIGKSQHFAVVMPEGPGSFWAYAREKGIKHSAKSFHDAIEAVSYDEAIRRGNYWCQQNGTPYDPNGPTRSFSFSFESQGLPAQTEKKIPAGWSVIAIHSAFNWQFDEWTLDGNHQVVKTANTVDSLASLVHHRGFQGGPVLLLSCRAGSLSTPKDYDAAAAVAPNPAQRLANIFKAPVVAASGFIYYSADGGRFNSRKGRMGTRDGQSVMMPGQQARWRCFVPGRSL